MGLQPKRHCSVAQFVRFVASDVGSPYSLEQSAAGFDEARTFKVVAQARDGSARANFSLSHETSEAQAHCGVT
ncbi:MAG: hypothetical protein NVSMB48_09100 [Marmoricola sp.]